MSASTTKKSTTRKPAAAKAPEDRKPKGGGMASVVVRGVTVEVAAEAMDDFELMDDIARMEESPVYLPRVLRRLVGEEGYRALLDVVRGDSGRVSLEDGAEIVGELLEALNPSS